MRFLFLRVVITLKLLKICHLVPNPRPPICVDMCVLYMNPVLQLMFYLPRGLGFALINSSTFLPTS